MMGDDADRSEPLTNRERMIGEFRDARLRRSQRSFVQPVIPPPDSPAQAPAVSCDQRDLMRLDTDKDDAAVTTA